MTFTTAYAIAQNDLDAYFEYSLQRSRRDSWKVGGAFATLVGVTVFLTFWWLTSVPVVALACGAIPAALVLFNALRDSSRERWKSEFLKFNPPGAIPLGPRVMTIDDHGIKLAISGHIVDIGWFYLDLAITKNHAFILMPYYRSEIVPLSTMTKSDRAALLEELKSHIRAKRKLLKKA